jgi:hypothetical protein
VVGGVVTSAFSTTTIICLDDCPSFDNSGLIAASVLLFAGAVSFGIAGTWLIVDDECGKPEPARVTVAPTGLRITFSDETEPRA